MRQNYDRSSPNSRRGSPPTPNGGFSAPPRGNTPMMSNSGNQPAYRITSPVHQTSQNTLYSPPLAQATSSSQLLSPSLHPGGNQPVPRRSSPGYTGAVQPSPGSYSPTPSYAPTHSQGYVSMPQASSPLSPANGYASPQQQYYPQQYYPQQQQQYYGQPGQYYQVPVNPAYYYANVRPIYIHQYMFDINQGAQLVKKEIPLTKDGNLVVDYPLAGDVLKDAKYRQGKEFTHLRYTPITCEPNDMPKHFSLRQIEMRRQTKIALVVTMYNEDEVLFCKSIKSVFKNVRKFCDYYGPDWWQNIVVVIVSGKFTFNSV